jgi:hypothetical protein
MKSGLFLTLFALAAICVCAFATACAKNEPGHKITAQEWDVRGMVSIVLP